MNKKSNRHRKTLWTKFCEWEYWYIVWRIVLLPIWLIVLAIEAYHKYRLENMYWTNDAGWQWLDKNLLKRVKNTKQADGSFLIKRLGNENDVSQIPDFLGQGWDSIISRYDYDFFSKFKPRLVRLLFEDYQMKGYKKYLSTDSSFYLVSKISTHEFPVDSNNQPTMIFFKKIQKKA